MDVVELASGVSPTRYFISAHLRRDGIGRNRRRPAGLRRSPLGAAADVLACDVPNKRTGRHGDCSVPRQTFSRGGGGSCFCRYWAQVQELACRRRGVSIQPRHASRSRRPAARAVRLCRRPSRQVSSDQDRSVRVQKSQTAFKEAGGLRTWTPGHVPVDQARPGHKQSASKIRGHLRRDRKPSTLNWVGQISIRASSTEDSRRRYRSMMAVSKGRFCSFGTVSVASSALVCRCRS